MNRRTAIISTIVLSAVFIVLGWLIYETVFAYVISGIVAQVVAYNPTSAFKHHLMMSLMMGFLGLMIGFSTLLSGRFSREIEYGKRFALFLCVGCISVAITIKFIAYQLNFVSKYADHNEPRLDWSISMVPLHEIGVRSAVAVLCVGLLFAVSYNKNKANKTLHTNP